jgi:hypothetical protein
MTEQQYVGALLRAYKRLPDCSGRTRSADRQLAKQLFRDGIPLDLVITAFRVALSRRRCRPPDLTPLPTIRSLHYFLPVIEEARRLHSDYLDYLSQR